MVEMLGVLAVVGVLSVGGMAAYKNAMDKHKASAVVADLSKRAIVLSGQIQFGQSPSLSGFSIYAGDYELAQMDNGERFFVPPDRQTFSMTVQDVPPEVCEKIINLNWKMASLRPADCSDSNLLFTFNADFSAISPTQALPALCQVDSDCVGCASCQNRQCVAECGKGLVCDSDKQVCGECVTNNDCEEGEFCLLDGTGYSPPYSDAKTCVSITDGKKYPYGLIYCPMTPITFNDAQRYCEALGGRLPTINEWKTLYRTVINGGGGRWTQDGSLYYQEYNGAYTYKPSTNWRGTSYGFCIKDAEVGSSCPDGTVLADDGSEHCVDCNSDADCGGDTPYCNTPWHVCVSCLTDAHCGQNSYCTTNTEDTMCDYYSAGCVTRDPSKKGHILNGKQWYWVKNGYATWYEANALCKAYGARMPTLAEFGYTQQADGTWACDTTKACGITNHCLVSDRFEGQTQCKTSKATGGNVRTDQLKSNGGTSEPSYACCVVD